MIAGIRLRYYHFDFTRYMDVLNPREPFERLTLWSAGLTVILIFPINSLLRVFSPALSEALFVPLGTAFFIGTLTVLAEWNRKRYGQAVLGFVIAVFLFPFLSWLILVLFHIPPQTKEADFLALIPQGIAAPSFFYSVRKRFQSEGG